MKNTLQERAYMALLVTMSQPKDLPLPEVEELQEQKPRNQFHAQILAQANQPPVAHKFWDTQSRPVEPCRGYEFEHINCTIIDDFGSTKKIYRNHRGYDWPINPA